MSISQRFWPIVFLLAVGTFMFWGAGHYTVFDDEAFSCRRYTLPMAEMIAALWRGEEPDPPLYYVFENLWVVIFGVGPLALRMPSILFFLAGLLAMRAAGRAWFDEPVGNLTFVLCGLHPAHLFLGFAARWYGLLFLMVALLTWATARLVTKDRPWRFGWLYWGLAAAGVCYTNYFGPVVAGLLWLVGVWKTRHVRESVKPWPMSIFLLAVFYAAWMVPFFNQLTRFPSVGGSPRDYLAIAARTTTTLLAGNLFPTQAAPKLVFVLVACNAGLFLLGMPVLVLRFWRKVWPTAIVVLGSLAAGIFSLTMIDKYVMTLSGLACMMVACLICSHHESKKGLAWLLGHITLGTLGSIWLLSMSGLITERGWSSLRWLDPFERAARDIRQDMTQESDVEPVVVMSHPSARYYYACLQFGEANDGACRIDGEAWRRFALPPEESNDVAADAPHTDRSFIAAYRDRPWPRRIVTLEAAGFADAPEWQELKAGLERDYRVIDERKYLEDPDAATKDRLDPRYVHPPWRIVVRWWEKKH